MANKVHSRDCYIPSPMRRSPRLKRESVHTSKETRREEQVQEPRETYGGTEALGTNEKAKMSISTQNLHRSQLFKSEKENPDDRTRVSSDPCLPASVDIDYESLRKARILENKARMKFFGISKSADELRTVISSSKSKEVKMAKVVQKRICVASTRRSDRLKRVAAKEYYSSPLDSLEDEQFHRSLRKRMPPDQRSRTGRGKIYDSVLGICCHYCRQKTLCSEEGCRHCEDGDTREPCIGKTECSVCHSSNGVLCRACLSVRYGEEMEEVRKNKEWMCPHCVEEQGINPLWICNSSLCLKKRKMKPTGIAIYRARELGFKSVAHFLMDMLRVSGPPQY